MNESHGDGRPGIAEATCIVGCGLDIVSLDKPLGLRGESHHPHLSWCNLPSRSELSTLGSDKRWLS